jgi:hypothetical protein
VAETLDAGLLRDAVQGSLLAVTGMYRVRRDGDLQYDGVRPDGGAGRRWVAHGYFSRLLWMLLDGERVRRVLWKRRWLSPDETHTCHSRPPEDVPSLGCVALIVVLKLWAGLDGGEGLCNSDDVLPDLQGQVHERTVERWLHRALPHALEIEQSIRRAVLERCEPRPVERLFPTGLSPPEGLLRRRWRDPSLVGILWRALALLLVGAVELSVPAALLLAEARGRCGTPGRPSLF